MASVSSCGTYLSKPYRLLTAHCPSAKLWTGIRFLYPLAPMLRACVIISHVKGIAGRAVTVLFVTALLPLTLPFEFTIDALVAAVPGERNHQFPAEHFSTVTPYTHGKLPSIPYFCIIFYKKYHYNTNCVLKQRKVIVGVPPTAVIIHRV